MSNHDLEKLPLPELCDLLVTTTDELLTIIEQKAGGIEFRDKKLEVEKFQAEIKKRRSEKKNKN